MRSTSPRSNALKLTSSILGSALFSLLVGCAPSAYDGGPRTPTVLWGPGQGAPGPGTPRVHLELDPPDSTLPEVELRQVAGLEAQLVSGGGPMASWQGARIVPGSIGICPVPCGAVINGRENRDFFFGGQGVHVSSHFQLGNEGGDILIKVHPRSGVQWKAGEVLTILGSPLLLLGTIVLTNNLIKGADSTAPATVFTGTSAALVAAGIVLMVTGRTTYSIHRAWPPRTGP